MRWRRKIGILFSRRLRRIIYVVTVSVMISLAMYNQFGENVSRNSRAHSIHMSKQMSLPKPVNLKEDVKINRSLKRLRLEERVSNVRYVTIDPRKITRRPKIVSSSKNHAKVESVELKRTRDSYKRAIRSQFQYTQMSIGDRDGLFNTNSQIQRRRDPKSSAGRSAAYVKGSIRFYVKPEWFSGEDIESMVTLSAKDITRVIDAKLHSTGINWKTLMFTKDRQQDFQFSKDVHQSNLFYGLASHSLSLHEVLAFHLDRVLGIGRALPAVAKHIKGPVARTLNIQDNSLHSILAIDTVDIQPVDGLIKRNVLACKSVQLADAESKSRGCGDIDGLEWGKLALFDFLLQIHNRLNPHCCGFQPDSNNKCLITLDTKHCSNTDQKLGTVYKARSNNQLIFLKNEMNLKSLGNSIDFEILQGVRKFPTRAVDIIRKGKLKLMLLQSLFIDKAYWDGVGGRGGVEQMINVVVGRARLFLEYYDTHTIKVQY